MGKGTLSRPSRIHQITLVPSPGVMLRNTSRNDVAGLEQFGKRLSAKLVVTVPWLLHLHLPI